MPTYSLILLLVLGPELLGGAGTLSAGAETAGSVNVIGKLVRQLGSTKFTEREAAMHALDAIGSPALDALKRATADEDFEIRRRAESLARQIQKRLETAQLLEPKRIHLIYEEMPLAEAVSDFARKAGFAIRLGESKGLAERKITLDTGETTFWKAFDQFCQKASVFDLSATGINDSSRQWESRRGGGVVTFTYQGSGGSSNGVLTLVDGKPQPLATHYAGAVCIRGAQVRGTNRLPPINSGETAFALKIMPEPRLSWQNVVDVRVEKATDENGQDLVPALPLGTQALSSATVGAGGIIWDAETGRPISDTRDVLVRLKVAEKPSMFLKEVRGAIAARIRTPPQPIVTVKEVLKTAGRTIKGLDTKSLRMCVVHQETNGSIRLRVQVEDSLVGTGGQVVRRGGRGGRLVIQNGVVLRGSVMQEVDDDSGFSLLDEKGQAFELVSKSSPEVVANVNGLADEFQLTFRPREGQGEAANLVYSGRRNVLIEIPFTLNDVPLP